MQRLVTRRVVLATIGATALAGCQGGDQSDAGTDTNSVGDSATGATVVPTRDVSLPLPNSPSTLRDQAVSGGPPKDGIPSIDDPTFESAEEAADRLDPGDPVFGLAIDGTVKAYPQTILVSHEICNDVVAGTPVSVTYCPLTGTAMGFQRGETTFGVSGRLLNNNLIMYDRATETWWPQVLATAIPGPWNEAPTGQSLQEFRLVWTTFERWTNVHPDTQVLSRETGFARNYDGDPYGQYNPRRGYYAPDSEPMFSSHSDDDRLNPKRVVLGARTADGAVAVEKNRLRETKLVDGELGGTPVVAAYDPALDTGYVFRNPDGRTFQYRDGRIEDDTGETYAPSDPPHERILAFDAMWFAWSGFYPETTLYA